MEFERENEIMDERQEMMDDAIDEATGMEGEEEEGEDIVKEVLDEIGVDLGQAVCLNFQIEIYIYTCADHSNHSWAKHPQTSRRRLQRRLELLRPWVAGRIRMTTTFKLGSIAFDDDDNTF